VTVIDETQSGQGNAASQDGTALADDPVIPFEGTISVAFWMSMLTAMAIYAAIALAPRLDESIALQQRFYRDAAYSSVLMQEVEHLTRVANALERDAEFRHRVAAIELQVSPRGTTEIPVSKTLGYDARIPVIQEPVVPKVPWYAELVHDLSRPTVLRSRLLLSAIGLLTVAFTCLNPDFFKSRLGSGFRWVLSCLAQRYRSA